MHCIVQSVPFIMMYVAYPYINLRVYLRNRTVKRIQYVLRKALGISFSETVIHILINKTFFVYKRSFD